MAMSKEMARMILAMDNFGFHTLSMDKRMFKNMKTQEEKREYVEYLIKRDKLVKEAKKVMSSAE